MRTIIIFAMILTFIFAMVGCNANSEPDKKAVESSSANAIVDITQAEDLFEKTEDETVEKSTFAEEKTQSPATKIDTEKVSKEPIFSQTTTANTEPKHKILIRKQNRPKAKNLSLKSQQILFRKSQQQLNKLKNLIYRIGFLTLRIMLKVLV